MEAPRRVDRKGLLYLLCILTRRGVQACGCHVGAANSFDLLYPTELWLGEQLWRKRLCPPLACFHHSCSKSLPRPLEAKGPCRAGDGGGKEVVGSVQ